MSIKKHCSRTAAELDPPVRSAFWEMAGSQSAAPVSGRERIHSLDVVRGVALFGILLMNITVFGLSTPGDPTVSGGETGANLWAWITTDMLFEGTFRGLFSILFGAGFIVLTSRLEALGRSDVADIYYRRSLWLIVFGMIDAYLFLWFGDILYHYGVIALMLYPLRKLSPKVMLGVAAAALIAGAIWNLADLRGTQSTWQAAQTAQAQLTAGRQLSEQQQADLDAWQAIEEKAKPDAQAIEQDVAAHRGSYLDVLAFTAPIAAQMESWTLYRAFFDIFSMMLIGMALFKMGVLTLQQPRRVYWIMVLIGYTAGLAVNYHELRTVLEGNFSVLSFMSAHWTYDFGRVAMTLGHLGALLLFCRSGWLPWLQRRLGAVGRMALTNYLSHSIICAVIFYGFGFGLYGQLERHQLYYVVFGIWVFQLIASPMWLKHFQYGPVEWLWRSLTYVERQPMLRRPAVVGAPVSFSLE